MRKTIKNSIGIVHQAMVFRLEEGNRYRAGKMDQRVKALVTMPDDWSLIHGTHKGVIA